MRFKILIAFILTGITACANAPIAAPAPSVPPNAPSAPAPQVPTQSALPNDAASDVAIASACGTSDSAPLNEFRSDPPSKLANATKSKLVEFFAFW